MVKTDKKTVSNVPETKQVQQESLPSIGLPKMAFGLGGVGQR